MNIFIITFFPNSIIFYGAVNIVPRQNLYVGLKQKKEKYGIVDIAFYFLIGLNHVGMKNGE